MRGRSAWCLVHILFPKPSSEAQHTGLVWILPFRLPLPGHSRVTHLGEVEAWLNPNPASCTRHPSLHFILPMAWDPFSAEVLHCCLPAVLALTRQHSCGTPQGGARDHCLELDNPSGMGIEACSPGSRVVVESGLVGGGALPRRACLCKAGLGAGLGWSLSHAALPGPCSPQGSRCWGESGG